MDCDNLAFKCHDDNRKPVDFLRQELLPLQLLQTFY